MQHNANSRHSPRKRPLKRSKPFLESMEAKQIVTRFNHESFMILMTFLSLLAVTSWTARLAADPRLYSKTGSVGKKQGNHSTSGKEATSLPINVLRTPKHIGIRSLAMIGRMQYCNSITGVTLAARMSSNHASAHLRELSFARSCSSVPALPIYDRLRFYLNP